MLKLRSRWWSGWQLATLTTTNLPLVSLFLITSNERNRIILMSGKDGRTADKTIRVCLKSNVSESNKKFY